MYVVSESSNLASWAAAAVALLAVVVGPLVSRWQINQTARTTEAINRIQLMTDDLAAFVALSSSLATNPRLHKTDPNEWKNQIDRLSFYKARIALRLNPSRAADAAINDTANKLANMLANPLKHDNLSTDSLVYINKFPDELAEWKTVTWSDSRANF
ncbi:hypothetical protein FE845_18135 [Marinobacter sp. 1-4A]|uniref:hypothetical protein n=1 Tax=Marinobacter sp. 1-4A TaxID=2582919 RepID=UPI0019065A80|nr:hypothetical protein [Marinobacter sp. 1-4A]MBK1853270.1 hypothetical protein [Marinobacter sp. 1-4A]